ncbi:hypothetical protein Btru_037647 [Bulinus truncatus]|nr:hypothetical protein Btru_037647 [Bulinus truncatus]
MMSLQLKCQKRSHLQNYIPLIISSEFEDLEDAVYETASRGVFSTPCAKMTSAIQLSRLLFLVNFICERVLSLTDDRLEDTEYQANYLQCREMLEHCRRQFAYSDNTSVTLTKYKTCIRDIPNTGDLLCEFMKTEEVMKIKHTINHSAQRIRSSSTLDSAGLYPVISTVIIHLLECYHY